tara:strand:- start:459 stop:725 length:267 start_codon:yes stop_codon:yes gene_type:complete
MAFMNTNSKLVAMKAALEEDKPEFVETHEDVLLMRRNLILRATRYAQDEGRTVSFTSTTWTKAWSTRGDERRKANGPCNPARPSPHKE